MLLVLVGAILAAVVWTNLDFTRHLAFQTNALDLGYETQTLWNTIHGRPFLFSTFDGLSYTPDITLDPALLHRPHLLLAFHVEMLLLVIAPFFALWPDPRFLLAFQAVIVASGALVCHALARRRTGSELAGVVFGLAWLLSPSVGAAALADFHTVAVAATLLLLTLYFIATERFRLALLAAALTALAREDAALFVGALGAYLWLRQWLVRRWRGVEKDPFNAAGRLGLVLLIGAGGWGLIAFGLIAPFFNGTIGMLRRGGHGTVGSVFWLRYNWLGRSPPIALVNVFRRPGLWLSWFAQRDVLAYLGTLALSGGVVALLAPGELLLALPGVLENSLSSFDWMRSGGAHYSILIIPFLFFAAIEATRRWVSRPLSLRMPFKSALYVWLAVIIGAALANQIWLGASPLVPGFHWPSVTSRDAAIASILAQVPSNAATSSTSSIYAHLATREAAYWYPSTQDAQYVAVDVAGSTDPMSASELHAQLSDLLGSSRFGIEAAAPGFLLLRRGAASVPIPPTFFDFARASPEEVANAAVAPRLRFADALLLDRYQIEPTSTLTIFGPTATLVTYWHVERPVSVDYSFDFFLTRQPDGAIIGDLRDQAPEPIWYPTSRWRPGEEVQLRLKLSWIGNLQAIGVALVDPTTGQRLPLQAPSGAAVWDNGTIGRVARLDGR